MHRCVCPLNLAVARLLRLRNIQGTRIDFVDQPTKVRTRSLAVVQADVLVALVRILGGVTHVFQAGATAWHRRVFL